MDGKTVVRTENAPAPFQGAPYSQAIKANGSELAELESLMWSTMMRRINCATAAIKWVGRCLTVFA